MLIELAGFEADDVMGTLPNRPSGKASRPTW
jgi:hypothetical protein